MLTVSMFSKAVVIIVILFAALLTVAGAFLHSGAFIYLGILAILLVPSIYILAKSRR
jgi:hypothetical protein